MWSCEEESVARMESRHFLQTETVVRAAAGSRELCIFTSRFESRVCQAIAHFYLSPYYTSIISVLPTLVQVSQASGTQKVGPA